MVDPKTLQNSSSIESQQQRVETVPQNLHSIVSDEMWRRLTYEQRSLLLDLQSLPSKLVGVVPESVWGTLSDEQKLEFLFSHSLLPRVEQMPRADSELEQLTDPVEGVADISGDRLVENGTVMGGEVLLNKRSEVAEEFDSLKERVRKVEEDVQTDTALEDEELSPEDVDRIKVETGATFSNATVPRFAGYQPTEQLLNNVDQNIHGDPASSKTWASNIIHKIWMALSQT